MEAIVFIGIQASGKSTFYRARFFDTHVRISLDLLRTRRRERLLLAACIEAQQPFVVDNTNVTREERARYLAAARPAAFRAAGYFFEPDPAGSALRNAGREEAKRVPPAGLFGTLKRLERPTAHEGFDALFRVTIAPGGEFAVEPWAGAPSGG
ncbi:MAG TPA: AAA family ATPase [Longimicrobiaceae bacterium]|nr:AAA family ATPase [Longimicrobiaceae bacterium]